MDDSATLLTIPASTWVLFLKETKPSVYLLHRAGWIAGFSVNGIYANESAAVGRQGASRCA